MKNYFIKPIFGALTGYAVSQYLHTRLPKTDWTRTSFNGGEVSLLSGLDVAIINTFATATLLPRSFATATLLVNGLGAVAGWVDDHLETNFSAYGKGFKGHLGALKEGKFTSGVIKILVIGGGSFTSSIIIAPQKKILPVFLDTVIIAGSANLINLLDLRPGRALKVIVVAGSPHLLRGGVASGVALSLVISALTALPDDLAGKTMLGDLGANALGGVLGVLQASIPGSRIRLITALGITGLTAVSEKVSFSQVIENNDFLRKIDQLGRK